MNRHPALRRDAIFVTACWHAMFDAVWLAGIPRRRHKRPPSCSGLLDDALTKAYANAADLEDELEAMEVSRGWP